MAMGFDYSIAPDKPRVDCCYEIEVVIEKITPPKYAVCSGSQLQQPQRLTLIVQS
jgi:hypothetical protein